MNRRAVHEARQLVRLRELCENAARAALGRCRAEQAERQRVVRQREQQIEQVRVERRALLTWLVGPGAPALPRITPIAAARQAALDDELERAEFKLIDERQALAQATRALAAAQAAWVAAQARRQAVEQLAADARRALGRQREQRAEREIDMPANLAATLGTPP